MTLAQPYFALYTVLGWKVVAEGEESCWEGGMADEVVFLPIEF